MLPLAGMPQSENGAKPAIVAFGPNETDWLDL